MDVTTLNQLIDTGGLIFIALLGFLAVRSLNAKRLKYADEARMLKDILFLRVIIDKYASLCGERLGKQMKNDFIGEARSEMGYSVSDASSVARVEKRLRQLIEVDEQLSKAINSIKQI